MGTDKRERQKANRQLKYQQQAKDQQRQKLTRRVVIGAIAVVGGVAFVLFLAWAFASEDEDEPTPTSTIAPATTVASTADTTTDDTTGTTTDDTAASPDGFTYGSGPCPPDEATEPVRQFDDAPQLCIDPAAVYTARFVTSLGDIVVDLAPEDVPGTVNNFVTLARYGYYDDTLVFRTNTSIDIIQGGGRTNTDSPGYEIPDEGSGFTYTAGQIAMARTANPNSAGAQWFFVVTDEGAPVLDDAGTYVVFGEVTEGLDVAAAILALAGDDGDTPTEEVVLETVEITETAAS